MEYVKCKVCLLAVVTTNQKYLYIFNVLAARPRVAYNWPRVAYTHILVEGRVMLEEVRRTINQLIVLSLCFYLSGRHQ